MQNYLNLLSQLVDKGASAQAHRQDRTNVGTCAVFGERLIFDLNEGFPLLTTKRVHFRSVFYELLWFLRGQTNVKWLRRHGVSIWDEWADDQGELGDIYGAQWRRWRSSSGDEVDQISQLIDGLKANPNSRRHLVSAWNPGELAKMALPPCHIIFQMFVEDGRLSCQIYQRSCDVFLGLPFNIASYALLTHLVAHQCDYRVAKLIWIGGDTHLYLNHFEAAKTQLSRRPVRLPQLRLRQKPDTIEAYRYEDIELRNYRPQPAIPAPIAV